MFESMGIIVRLVDLPPRVHGMTSLADDGSYNVYINSRMNDCGQRAALLHEIRHVLRGDFHREAGIDEIEDM